MNSRLEKLVENLDRVNVNEIVIAVGRPISVREDGVYVPLAPKSVTLEELGMLFEGTPVSVPTDEGTGPPIELSVGRHRVRVRAGRRGSSVVVRMELAPRGPGATRVKGTTTAPRTKTPTRGQPARTATRDKPVAIPRTATRGKRGQTVQPRTKQPSILPRTKQPSVQPRTKQPSILPRTKQPSVQPRTKQPSTPPRTKQPTATPTRSKQPTSAPANTTTSQRMRLDFAELGAPAESSRPTAKLGNAPLESSRPTSELPGGQSFELDLSLDDLVPPNAAPPAPPRKLTPTKLPGIELAAPAAPARARPATMRDVGPMRFSELVATARSRGATDLHIATGRPAIARIGGEMVPLHPSAPPVAAVEDTLHALLDPEQKGRLAEVGYVDLAIEIGGARLRANISRFQGGLRGAFRLAAAAPSQLHELGLPKELAKVVSHHQGLVIVAGPSGHGKTTTLAALVDLVNASKAHHIITVEDPIEIVYPRKMAVVSQREAGRHTKSFATALKASLREDPDVIVIGELRDRETVEIALTAAETGHLVLATMSTPSASKTIDRLIDVFPAEEQQQVRASVAGALRAIVAQRLMPMVGGGVVPAIELVTGVLPLAVMIRDDKLFQLPNLMQRGKAYGMIKLEDSIAELQRTGKIR